MTLESGAFAFQSRNESEKVKIVWLHGGWQWIILNTVTTSLFIIKKKVTDPHGNPSETSGSTPKSHGSLDSDHGNQGDHKLLQCLRGEEEGLSATLLSREISMQRSLSHSVSGESLETDAALATSPKSSPPPPWTSWPGIVEDAEDPLQFVISKISSEVLQLKWLWFWKPSVELENPNLLFNRFLSPTLLWSLHPDSQVVFGSFGTILWKWSFFHPLTTRFLQK